MNDSDERDDQGRRAKPTPIREVVGETPPSPPQRTDEAPATAPPEQGAPGMRGQRERPKGRRDKGVPRERGAPHGKSRDRGAGRRPPPARDAINGPGSEPTSVEALPSCEFTTEGVEWIARLSGRSATGSTSDPGAQLLHLTFYRASDPLVALREALIPGDSIDHLFEVDLEAVLASAREAIPPGPTPEARPTPRGGRGRR